MKPIRLYIINALGGVATTTCRFFIYFLCTVTDFSSNTRVTGTQERRSVRPVAANRRVCQWALDWKLFFPMKMSILFF